MPAVVDRARALGSRKIGDDTALAVVAALPRTRWLDDERRWFALADPLGRLETALDKIFAVVAAIPFDELRAALARSLIGARQAPAPVLRRYLVELGRCAIEPARPRGASDEIGGARVCRAARAHIEDGERAVPQPLTRPEAAIVQLLAQAGGELDARTLRQLAHAAGVPRTTVNQLVKASPVLALVLTPPRVRLIGCRPWAAGAW